MDKNKLKIALGVAGAFFLVAAIVLFVLGITLDMNTLPRVILIIISVLCLALAVELGYFLYLTVDTKPNYFLFNPQAKRNIPPQKLTFQIINARMNRFLSGYAASEGKIWNDRVLDDPNLVMPAEFKPIVAYKLLFGLAESDTDAGWRCLENASDGTVNFICAALSVNGDDTFASTIKSMMSEYPVNMKLVRDYLVKNKKYIQKKMTVYVVSNIDKF